LANGRSNVAAAAFCLLAIVSGKSRQRRLKRAAKPAERGPLLLHNFVVEGVLARLRCFRSGRAQGHGGKIGKIRRCAKRVICVNASRS
jgi:hypothetical protein